MVDNRIVDRLFKESKYFTTLINILLIYTAFYRMFINILFSKY